MKNKNKSRKGKQKPGGYTFVILNPRDDGRTSIRFTMPIWEMADACMEHDGHTDLSAFLSDLVRRRYEALLESQSTDKGKVSEAADAVTRRALRSVRGRSTGPEAPEASLCGVFVRMPDMPPRVILGFQQPLDIPLGSTFGATSNPLGLTLPLAP